jgi:putative restriction endonuclease
VDPFTQQTYYPGFVSDRVISAWQTYVEGLGLWNAVQDRMGLARPAAPGAAEDQARFGEPHLLSPRLGQGAFRVLVTDLYSRRCAVTHERTLPALEAAHIRPYAEGGQHEARNGLLLRRDLHSLFDAGYVTVAPDFRFNVSRRIREEFDNGRHYYELHGQRIALPDDASKRPDPAALTWHNETCFRG